ncbi:MAG: 2-amino-4-hydroxy-6-hydroxymethyldihydropteridine diphosphokinase [Candidatus Omnitrophota bacterium]
MKVFIALGSNIGERRDNIERAIACLREYGGIEIRKVSTVIESEPSGGPAQGNYLNAVIEVETNICPKNLLKVLKSIEKKLGRLPAVRFGPRIIDLDILLYGELIVNESNLSIPHPRMFTRCFVLKPLLEIAPDIVSDNAILREKKDIIAGVLKNTKLHKGLLSKSAK